MWQSLHLRSLGVIAEAEVEFGPGFTVITGETGAGKTMVVTALALLRGQRANASMIRRGSDQARIEASVLLNDAELAELVKEAGGEVDEELILAR
ncbi:MAG: AAA family ATPase, partial [Actinomycetales bacterium]|nr:AAA family ATPase [Actinomycetales bacterium]